MLCRTTSAQHFQVNEKNNSVQKFDSIKEGELKILIPTRKWNQIHKILLELCFLEKLLFKHDCSENCCANHNILQYIMMFDPPLKIVKIILIKSPDLARSLDCRNRFPLQIGLFHGLTSIDVVRILLHSNDISVQILDIEGKSALHLALDGYENILQKEKRKIGSELHQKFSEIIDILCFKDPSIVIKEDKNEINAVEYALEKEVELSIVAKLQKLSMDVMKSSDRKPIVSETSKIHRRESSNKRNFFKNSPSTPIFLKPKRLSNTSIKSNKNDGRYKRKIRKIQRKRHKKIFWELAREND